MVRSTSTCNNKRKCADVLEHGTDYEDTTHTLLQDVKSGIHHLIASMEVMKESFESKLEACAQDISDLKRDLVDVKQHGEMTVNKLDAYTQDTIYLKRELVDVKLYKQMIVHKLDASTQDIHKLKSELVDAKQYGKAQDVIHVDKLDACAENIRELKSELIDVKQHGLVMVHKLDGCAQDISNLKSQLLVGGKVHDVINVDKLDACVPDSSELKCEVVAVKHEGVTVDNLETCTPQMSDTHESFIDSNIISPNDERHVRTWLHSVGMTSTPKLLYRASMHGWRGYDFHRQCDGKGKTLTVIESSKGGYIFGGYLDKSWHSNMDYISSSKAFLFSLHCHAGLPPRKFDLKKGRQRSAACGHASYGPIFGGGLHDIFISSNANYNSISFTNENSYMFPSEVNTQKLFTGSKNFIASEVEVFLVT